MQIEIQRFRPDGSLNIKYIGQPEESPIVNNILNECRYNYGSYLWNRPYYNNLKSLCSPGDKVRIVFYKEVPTVEAELREKLGILEMIMARKIASLKKLPPEPDV